MRNIQLILTYDGTDFHGWQRQPGLRTVQHVLEDTLHQLTGAAGSHDGQQSNRPRRPRARTIRPLLDHIAALTRDDGSSVERPPARRRPRARRQERPQAFHATLDARSKRYRYAIDNGPIASPFQLRYAWHVRRNLDVVAMATAGAALLGRHDFHSFETDWPNRTSSVRHDFRPPGRAIGPICLDRSRSRRLPVQYGAINRRNARLGRLRQAPPGVGGPGPRGREPHRGRSNRAAPRIVPGRRPLR